MHGHLGGTPPQVDLSAEKSLAELLRAVVGLVTCAHDLSDGGLAQTLVEAALRNDIGVRVSIPGDAFVGLFAESAGRVLVSVKAEDVEQLRRLADQHGVPIMALGETGGDTLEVDGQFAVPLSVVRRAWADTLPNALA